MKYLHISSTRMPHQICGGMTRQQDSKLMEGRLIWGSQFHRKIPCSAHSAPVMRQSIMVVRTYARGWSSLADRREEGRMTPEKVNPWRTCTSDLLPPMKPQNLSKWINKLGMKSLVYRVISHHNKCLSFFHWLCKRTVKICFDSHMSYQKWMSFPSSRWG